MSCGTNSDTEATYRDKHLLIYDIMKVKATAAQTVLEILLVILHACYPAAFCFDEEGEGVLAPLSRKQRLRAEQMTSP